MSRATIGAAAPAQLNCEQKEKRAADRDDHAIDRARKPERPGQLRSENKEAAVDQDLPRRRSSSRNNRQHGNAGTGIVIAAIERESPKWGGVQRKMMRKSTRDSSPTYPAAAAHPITGGRAPAAPPITMFWDVFRFSQAV